MYGRISIFGSDIERIEKLWRTILVTGDLKLLPCPLSLALAALRITPLAFTSSFSSCCLTTASTHLAPAFANRSTLALFSLTRRAETSVLPNQPSVMKVSKFRLSVPSVYVTSLLMCFVSAAPAIPRRWDELLITLPHQTGITESSRTLLSSRG